MDYVYCEFTIIFLFIMCLLFSRATHWKKTYDLRCHLYNNGVANLRSDFFINLYHHLSTSLLSAIITILKRLYHVNSFMPIDRWRVYFCPLPRFLKHIFSISIILQCLIFRENFALRFNFLIFQVFFLFLLCCVLPSNDYHVRW